MASKNRKSPPETGALFPEDDAVPPEVRPANPGRALQELASALPDQLRLGTSSWHFPGWAGLVWDKLYGADQLSREGLGAYARHPLFRTVSLDRAFYRPLSAAQYADYASRVPESFRFVVKAPARITDAMVRDSGGRGQRINPDFMDARVAWRDGIEPAIAGLGCKLGALVFQFSPLPRPWLDPIEPIIERLNDLLREVAGGLAEHAPQTVVAVEVRNPEWLMPAFVKTLKDTGATYCLGLHPRMPSIAEQLPILRRLWPGPLVCRWNLNLKHGVFGYESARKEYAPFDKLIDPDPDTRMALSRVIAGTVGAGQPAYVTLNNKAEGSAPRSVAALAEAVRTAID